MGRVWASGLSRIVYRSPARPRFDPVPRVPARPTRNGTLISCKAREPWTRHACPAGSLAPSSADVDEKRILGARSTEIDVVRPPQPTRSSPDRPFRVPGVVFSASAASAIGPEPKKRDFHLYISLRLRYGLNKRALISCKLRRLWTWRGTDCSPRWKLMA